MPVANQRTVQIHRENPLLNKNSEKHVDKTYLCVFKENITNASRDLSSSIAFKLWIYFALNQDEYIKEFSPAHFTKEYGCSMTSAKDAFTKLVDKGYLVLDKRHPHMYHFYESPQDNIDFFNSEPEKRRVSYNGYTRVFTYNELKEGFTGKLSQYEIDKIWEGGEPQYE